MEPDKDLALNDPVTHRELEYVLRPLLDGLTSINAKLDELRNHRESTIVDLASLKSRVDALETGAKTSDGYGFPFWPCFSAGFFHVFRL